MFELENRIAEWRREWEGRQVANCEALDELESHLRQDIREQVDAGLSADLAFESAVERLGHAQALRREFEKVGEIPEAVRWRQRVILVERDIVLPIKAVLVLVLVYSFYSSPWFGSIPSVVEIPAQLTQQVLWWYIGLNVLTGGFVVAARRVPARWLAGTVFILNVIDSLFLSLLCLATGGQSSILYWVFLGLVLRNCLTTAGWPSQALINVLVIGCYTGAALLELVLSNNLTPAEARVLELYVDHEGALEQLLIRVILLGLVAVCCGLAQQVLSQRFQRRKGEEAASGGQKSHV